MKIKKILLSLFVFIFFAVSVFFSLGMLIPGASVAKEGAGKMPHLIEDGKINDDIGDEFEDWFSKKFAYRGKVVDLFSSLKAELFKTGNDQVIVGDDDFLFFDETVASYTGVGALSDEEIEEAGAALKNISEYALEHDAKFLFVAAPDKATVYSDKMPARYKYASGETELDRLYSLLDDYGVEYLDLRDALIDASGENLIYHKRDTHWNGLGAFAALNLMAERLGVEIPDFGEASRVNDFEGDLDSLLYPGETRYDTDYQYDLGGKYMFTSAYTNEMNMSISSVGSGEGKMLIFRDSFANALIPMISSVMGETKFERANPYKVDLLESFDADYVVILIAERNIKYLIGSGSRINK